MSTDAATPARSIRMGLARCAVVGRPFPMGYFTTPGDSTLPPQALGRVIGIAYVVSGGDLTEGQSMGRPRGREYFSRI